MAEERDEEKFGGTEGNSGQPATGQQGEQTGLGQQPTQNPTEPAGESIGETPAGDLGSQGGQTSTGQTSTGQTQPDTGTDTLTQGGATGAETGTTPTGEGFIGSQGTGTDDYLQQDKATVETGAAPPTATEDEDKDAGTDPSGSGSL